jgi:ferrous iron transport protein A
MVYTKKRKNSGQWSGFVHFASGQNVSGAKRHNSSKNKAKNLTELKPGEAGVLEKLDLPDDDAQRLMEMGFIPGHSVTRGLSAPGGDPRVFRVDGTEVALRRETARRLLLK